MHTEYVLLRVIARRLGIMKVSSQKFCGCSVSKALEQAMVTGEKE